MTEPTPEHVAELDGTGFELVRQYHSATQTIKMWTDYRKEVREQLIKLLDQADYARFRGNTVVTVVRTRPRRFNTSAFAADHPDLFEQYREEAAEDEIRLSVGKLPAEGEALDA